MFRKIAVGDVMTRNFAAIRPDTTVLECARAMVRQRVGSLLIASKNKLLGIITRRDILWAIVKKPGIDLRTLQAMDIATKKVAVIKPSADLSHAFGKMKHLGFTRLPVIAKGELVGMITLKDILKMEPAYYAKTGDLIDVREESQKMQRLTGEEWESEGFCDACGAFADLLKVQNRVLCADCRDELY